VFQDFQLLTDRSIEQNLEFVMKATGWKDQKLISERLLDVLEKVGLRSKIKKMPHELSGGEQQRVVIARALLNDPELILADEPTGNLDPETSEEIVTLLKQISQSGTAVLMASHDYHIIRTFPSRIIKCEAGLVHEDVKI
jgi:cell division transport system ATP-binding protein